jgi:hypothetical protein
VLLNKFFLNKYLICLRNVIITPVDEKRGFTCKLIVLDCEGDRLILIERKLNNSSLCDYENRKMVKPLIMKKKNEHNKEINHDRDGKRDKI